MSVIIRKPAGAPGSTGGQFDGRTRTAAGGSLTLTEQVGAEDELKLNEDLVRRYRDANPTQKKLAKDLADSEKQAAAAIELDRLSEAAGYGKFKGTVIGYDEPHIIVEDSNGNRKEVYAEDLGIPSDDLFGHIKNVNSKDWAWMRRNRNNKQLLIEGEKRSILTANWEEKLSAIVSGKEFRFDKDLAAAKRLTGA